MATYKCISCGEVKESDGICSCPVCGYRMFEASYDRKSKLVSEITGFFSRLEVTTVMREVLVFEGIDKDSQRFPSYDQIVQYVTGAKRTETFLDNLLETASQLKTHYTTPFSNSYPISFEIIDGIIKEYDEVLLQAAQVLAPGAVVTLDPVSWEKTTLLYTERQNKYLWFSARELIELIEQLAKKIHKFIKLNNLYGNAYKYHPNQKKKQNVQGDHKDNLEDAIAQTENIIKKKYYVDIMDDGSEELREMLTCLWNSIEVIMRSPLFMENYDYLTDAGSFGETDFFTHISAILEDRYRGFIKAVNVTTLLEDKTEEDLFEVYKTLIGYDKFGFLVPVGTVLVNIGESEKKLNELIGLSGIKESIKKIKAYALANKSSDDLNIHMCFLGNPGTGKTEVARYIAGILYENGILPTNKVIEVDRSGLVSQYFGATAEKTQQVIARAMGGVLFIDEAYALGNNSATGTTDYGKEAIDTLVKAMEDHRGEFCVILAGYKNEMRKMIDINPGFKSRIQFMLDFPNYSREELGRITQLMLKDRGYSMGETALNRILDITDIKRKEPNFANAREIRNVLDQVIMCQNLRCNGWDDNEIGIVDVNRYIKDSHINLPISGNGVGAPILTAEEELDQLIGLRSVKRMVKKIKAYAKRNKEEPDFNLHMCFYGNPGTGKTEVARIMSRILYEAGVLAEAKLVETDAHGLMGRFVGETAPKTEGKILDAMGGVLFVDEAYRLASNIRTDGAPASYGDEAITVLLKNMEDHRGQFCTIFAGYQQEMQTMLGTNPGLKSRIQFALEFPDYSREELGEIADAFLKKKSYTLTEDALVRLLDVTDYYRKQSDFANARTVRNILDQVIMNQNLRTEDEPSNEIIASDVEDYILDEGIDLTKTSGNTRRIGFV